MTVMLIRAYGLFWSADEVEWFPGPGSQGQYMLLGRRGEKKPKLQLANFRSQSGLYILYGDYGPYYVGKADRLGRRLKQHLNDRHAGKWNRFSWFGFRPVLTSRNAKGLNRLKELKQKTLGTTPQAIAELEALLIRALGLENNYAKMSFPGADRWKQVRLDDVDMYLEKVVQK
jgi:predicted GIY-YIG superfamily endonuclease